MVTRDIARRLTAERTASVRRWLAEAWPFENPGYAGR
jgi:hypothetical protein